MADIMLLIEQYLMQIDVKELKVSQPTLQAIRGMNDMLPIEMPYWHRLESICREVAAQYAYQEIRFPIVEQTHLFKRSVGQATDIVEKEMYTFEDRNGDLLSLRPEGTAGCVRAGIEHGLLFNQVQRLWYLGPMFRHERPQKGRYRQFYQFGVEAFGMAGPDIDVEVIQLSQRLWERLGILDQLELQINSLGTAASRQAYRQVLVDYFKANFSQLDEDSQRRLDTNPLRILDSKNPAMRLLIDNAPRLQDHLDEASQQHFARLCELLEANHINYVINPTLVRGLDYYCFTVFEWVTHELGAQGTVCAGGRYDGLVEQLGGKSTPGIGFAMGLERLVLLLQQQHELQNLPHACMILMGEDATKFGMLTAEKLRDEIPALRLMTNLSSGGFKAQFKRADKSKARFALIIGDTEAQAAKISVKDLRLEKPQQEFALNELIEFLKNNIS